MKNFNRISLFVCSPLPLTVVFSVAALCLHQGATGLIALGFAAPAAALLIPLGILEAHRESPIALIASALAFKKVLTPLAYGLLGAIYVFLFILGVALLGLRYGG